MNRILYFVLVLMGFSFAFEANAQVRWYRNYTAVSNGDQGASLVKAPDGGYLLCGHENNHIYKLDPYGNVQWDQALAPSPDWDHTESVAVDSGFMVAYHNYGGTLHIERYDWSGQQQWAYTDPFTGGAFSQKTDAFDQWNDSLYVVLSNFSGGGTTVTGRLTCMKDDGDTLWTRASTSTDRFLVSTTPAANGDLWLLYQDEALNPATRLWLERVDVSGTIQQANFINFDGNIYDPQFVNENHHTTHPMPDGGFLTTFYDDVVDGALNLFRFDANGDTLWTRQHAISQWDYDPILVPNPSGTFFLCVTNYTLGGTGILKFSEDGQYLFRKDYANFIVPGLHRVADAIPNGHGGVILTGADQEPVNTVFVLSTDSMGNISDNIINGRIWHDDIANCTLDPSEQKFTNWSVKMVGGNISPQIVSTDANGQFELNADSGSYTLTVSPVPYWNNTCASDTVTLNLGTGLSNGQPQTTSVNFPRTAQVSCPYLTVDISTPFVRRCFTNNYYVTYCNLGTVSVDSAFVEVEFDQYLAVQSSSIPWVSQVGQTYRFYIGTLGVGDCGTFSVTTLVDCNNTVLGQSHCVEAHITPDTSCIPPLPSWDGSELDAEIVCLNNDSVALRFTNIGTGNMGFPVAYVVVEDDIMIMSGTIQLNSGQTWEDVRVSGGSSWYIRSTQTPNYPGYSITSAFLEGCGTNGGGTFSIGYSGQFPDDDLAPYLSIDCQPNIGAYDPNDKRGMPVGYSNMHYIDSVDRIDYHVRFQNTGTDTAFTVVVRDTLSTYLDPATVVAGASSHPYTLQVRQPGVLEFTFDNILLPDSNVNEPGSHGFIKFAIEQNPGNLPGTLIENRADIYFDFNAPVITNTAFHQIEDDFITVSLEEILLPNTVLQLQVAPHPLTDRAVISLIGAPTEPWTLELFTIEGRQVEAFASMGNTVEISRGQLAAGVYALQVKGEGGQVMATGKLVVR